MRIRWLWFDYVPSEISLTKAQRRFVSRTARKAMLSGVRNKVLFAGLITVVACISVMAYFVLLKPYLSSPARSLVGISSSILFGFVAGHVFCWFFAKPHAHRIVRELGINICPECGYDLHGLSGHSATCPECGWVSDASNPDAQVN